MRRLTFVPIATLACLAVAGPALAQASRPADEYRDVDLPARRSAMPTTRTAPSTTAVAGQGGNVDQFDSKRLGFALLIVVGAIFVTMKVWKRVGMPGMGGRASGALQVVSRLSVSPRQQVLLIRVGRRLVMVGNSGTQMNPLCEIADPDEVAEMIGKAATERDESPSSFAAVLGGEEKEFEPATNIDVIAGDDREIESTRDEISGLLDKVRNLSKQFNADKGSAAQEGGA
jgi:flagellar biogenesis protein FliO